MKAKDNTGSNNPPTTQDILGMTNSLSDRHVLKSMPPQYAAGFANAAVNVYDPTKIRKILRQKFYIPNEANFTEDAYLQSVAELSVSNHVRNAGRADCRTTGKAWQMLKPRSARVRLLKSSTVKIEISV